MPDCPLATKPQSSFDVRIKYELCPVQRACSENVSYCPTVGVLRARDGGEEWVEGEKRRGGVFWCLDREFR